MAKQIKDLSGGTAGSGMLDQIAQRVLDEAERLDLTISSAEQYTGGLLAALLSAGTNSHRFEFGYVPVSARSMSEMIDVPMALIDLEGPVTATITKLMAKGARYRSDADLAVAISGLSNETGGQPGLVHIAICDRSGRLSHQQLSLAGDHATMRKQAIAASLQMLLDVLHGRAFQPTSQCQSNPFILAQTGTELIDGPITETRLLTPTTH